MNLLIATIVLIFGTQLDSYFNLISIKSYLRGSIALIFILTLLNLKKPLLILLLILTISGFYIKTMKFVPPYDDQQEECLYKKSTMLFASFKEVYSAEEGNFYTYLPGILYLQAPFAVTGLDLRYFYLALLIIAGVITYKFTSPDLRILAIVLILICPEFLIRSLNMENTAIVLLAIVILLAFLPQYQAFPWSVSFLSAFAVATHQSIALLTPFILTYFIYKKEWKSLLIFILFLTLIFSPFVISNFYGFYRGTIWEMLIGQPQKFWSKYQTFIGWNLPTILTTLGINAKFIQEKISSLIIQSFIYFLVFFLYIKKLNRCKEPLYFTFKYSIIASLLIIFLSKRMRVMPSYYLTFLIPWILWDKEKFKISLPSSKTMGKLARIFVSLITIHILSGYFTGRHYFNKWCKSSPSRIINLQDIEWSPDKSLNYTPKPPLSLIRGYGFMNNNMRYTLTFLLPLGDYSIEIFKNKKQQPVFTTRENNKYYLLKIPLSLKENKIFIYNYCLNKNARFLEINQLSPTI